MSLGPIVMSNRAYAFRKVLNRGSKGWSDMRFGANCAYIILTTRKKSEFSADSNALISPKFRAGKIRAIREIRSQKIPL